MKAARRSREGRKQWIEEEIGGEEGRQQVETGLWRSVAAKGKRETVVARQEEPVAQAAERAVRKSEGITGGWR